MNSIIVVVLIFATFASLVSSQGSPPPYIEITGVVRDFTPQTNPDFEYRDNPHEKGIPRNTIKLPERIPEYANTPGILTVHSAETFRNWWTDNTHVFPLTIRLQRGVVSDPRIYTYNNQEFFPINGQGYGNYRNGKNYHFTFEGHVRFTYQGGERFTFTGDDDVFVFINDRLVIDLGGVHGALSETVRLDDVASSIGLVVGRTYRLDFFFAERHTSKSTFRIDTSIEIISCSYVDRCGVCEGTGTTCPCTCNDGNSCTDDSCNLRTGACQFVEKVCDDNDVCTSDSCNPSTGNCVFGPRNTCNDGDPCTVDSCHRSNGCINTRKNCDDGKVCTIDSCNSSGNCVNTNRTCNDDDPCTTDTCVEPFGCVNTKRCDPSSGCTEVCDCTQHPSRCDDGNPCTTDTCVMRSGVAVCENTPVNCPTTNPCLPQFCNTTNGACQSRPVDCNDGNICTDDVCVPVNGVANCTHPPKNCDDGNACTLDICTNPTGCNNSTLVVCDDGDTCTNDFCDPSFGCRATPISCDDGVFCTDQQCENGIGCLSFNKTCTVNINCFVGTCDFAQDRCVQTPLEGRNPLLCFSSLSDLEKGAVIGVGTIVGLSIGGVALAALAVFGGKKGYDAWLAHHNKIEGASTNPMYVADDRSGVNPFYKEEDL